jgi:hypothetical protein
MDQLTTYKNTIAFVSFFQKNYCTLRPRITHSADVRKKLNRKSETMASAC